MYIEKMYYSILNIIFSFPPNKNYLFLAYSPALSLHYTARAVINMLRITHYKMYLKYLTVVTTLERNLKNKVLGLLGIYISIGYIYKYIST